MRIKNFPSVESIDGSQDALVIEQTEDSVDKSRKVSPAQIKQYVQTGDFTATGEITDGHGNILKDMAKIADVNEVIGDLSQTGLTGDSVADQLGDASGQITEMAKTFDVNSSSFDIASKLSVGESAAVIVSDSSLCTAFAGDTNSLSGVVSRLANAVYAWNLATFNYKFIYVRTDASFTVSRRFYAAGTSF